MKKFLAFLLIAIVACTTVEDLTFKDFWSDIVDDIKGIIKKGIDWLKEHLCYDQLKNTLLDLGKKAAMLLCTKWLGQETCEAIISGEVWNWIKEKGFDELIKSTLLNFKNPTALLLCGEWLSREACEDILKNILN